MSGESVFVEVAGRRVHLAVSGAADGVPLLISDGLGGAWFTWDRVAAALPDRYRAIRFDRPGLGLSPPAAGARGLRDEVELLAGLAERAGGPVTVVAHSMAGFHAEALARRHPDLVRALVLVDPSYEPAARGRPRISGVVAPVARLLGRALEITRLARLVGPAGRRLVLRRTSRRGDAAAPDTVREVYGRGGVLGTVIVEYAAYREMAADLRALRDRRPFPEIPLVVLTALGDVSGARARRWAAGHRGLAGMSPRGRQVELPDALHMVPLDSPDVIVDAIAEVTGP